MPLRSPIYVHMLYVYYIGWNTNKNTVSANSFDKLTRILTVLSGLWHKIKMRPREFEMTDWNKLFDYSWESERVYIPVCCFIKWNMERYKYTRHKILFDINISLDYNFNYIFNHYYIYCFIFKQTFFPHSNMNSYN